MTKPRPHKTASVDVVWLNYQVTALTSNHMAMIMYDGEYIIMNTLWVGSYEILTTRSLYGSYPNVVSD